MLDLTITSQDVLSPYSSPLVFDPAAAMWRDLIITLPYNWAYMAIAVVGTDIFLCGGHMDRDIGEWGGSYQYC